MQARRCWPTSCARRVTRSPAGRRRQHLIYDGRQRRRQAGSHPGGGARRGSSSSSPASTTRSRRRPRVRYGEDGDLLAAERLQRGRWHAGGRPPLRVAAAWRKFRLKAGASRALLYDEVAYGQGVPTASPNATTRRRGRGRPQLQPRLGPAQPTPWHQQINKFDLFVSCRSRPRPRRVFVIDGSAAKASAGHVAFKQSDALSFETGAGGAWNWLRARPSLHNGAAIPLPAANVRVEELRGEAFTKGTWIPNPKLTVEAGLRMEASRISSEGDVALEKTLYFAKPRAVVTWSPDPADQVRVRVEREVGQLDFDDFVAATEAGVVTSGNPDLNPGRRGSRKPPIAAVGRALGRADGGPSRSPSQRRAPEPGLSTPRPNGEARATGVT